MKNKRIGKNFSKDRETIVLEWIAMKEESTNEVFCFNIVDIAKCCSKTSKLTTTVNRDCRQH